MSDFISSRDLSYFITCYNDKYIELVGTINDIRGRNASLALMFIAFISGMIFLSTYFLVNGGPSYLMWTCSIGLIFCFIFLAFLLKSLMFDAFRLTQYAVRVNRKSQCIYIFRHNKTCVKWSWENVRCTIVSSTGQERALNGAMASMWVNLIDKDSNEIIDSAPIASDSLNRRELLERLLLEISDFMDYKNNLNSVDLDFCSPGSTRREGLKFGIIHAFSVIHTAALKLIGSPIISAIVLGRWFAIYTSKLPKWSDEAKSDCKLEGGEMSMDWSNNKVDDFWIGAWPVICFFVGFFVDVVALLYFYKSLVI